MICRSLEIVVERRRDCMATHYWKSMWDPTEEEWQELAKSKKDLLRMRDNSRIAMVDNENRYARYDDMLLDVTERLKRRPNSIELLQEKQTIERKLKQTEQKIEFYRRRAEKAKQLLREKWNFESQTLR